ncbi:glycoside hydrolase family 25 protein [Paenibacillus sp. JX-17]|uniref:Glycoside hydrolase family 25 protein n=1 Tax=Paenibacillus lacisoli TaxID=3064525 RepID=A0ABT9CD29_9BACL|nr:glycoside hydrolase family 25 protein [Paenibacillus sp. JX-17]MDO7907175.1 glycoside hydrolase family 25 protein [Paenibacillus sp. JX-17]
MQNRSSSDVRGIDVSHHQGTIDWAAVREDGITFAFVKASQGQRFMDPQFVRNAQEAAQAGLLTGAYHFVDAVSQSEARLEARHFAAVLQRAGGAEAFMLPPVMDYENNPGSLKPDQITVVALAFLSELEQLTGRRPIVYTGNSFAANFGPALGAYDLWIARYSSRPPTDTTAWQSWNFWQYSDSGRVAGIRGNVDLNVYDGTEQQLRSAYITKEVSPMTAEEKAAFEALQKQVAELENSRDVLKQALLEQGNVIKQQAEALASLQGRQSMRVPVWAQDAVKAAAAFSPGSPLVNTTENSSYDFYRFMVVLYRLGLFEK